MANKNEDVTVIGVGIDTARYSHRVNFFRPDLEPAARPFYFDESRDGYDKLRLTLEKLHKRHPAACFNVRLDVAGQYARNLEVFIRELKLPALLAARPDRHIQTHHGMRTKRQKLPPLR